MSMKMLPHTVLNNMQLHEVLATATRTQLLMGSPPHLLHTRPWSYYLFRPVEGATHSVTRANSMSAWIVYIFKSRDQVTGGYI